MNMKFLSSFHVHNWPCQSNHLIPFNQLLTKQGRDRSWLAFFILIATTNRSWRHVIHPLMGKREKKIGELAEIEALGLDERDKYEFSSAD